MELFYWLFPFPTGNKFWQPTSESAVVCSKHFIEPDFVETPLRRRLKPTSVPSVFYMMQGKPYFVPSRRRKYESPTTPNLFPNSQHHEIVNNEGNETIDIIDNSNVIENSKYDAFLQASFADKKFLEMLQLNLEMLEVANHFLADYSLLE